MRGGGLAVCFYTHNCVEQFDGLSILHPELSLDRSSSGLTSA